MPAPTGKFSKDVINRETDARFWAQTGYKPGQPLHPSDPVDRSMIPTWRHIFVQVQKEADAGKLVLTYNHPDVERHLDAAEISSHAAQGHIDAAKSEPNSDRRSAHHAAADDLLHAAAKSAHAAADLQPTSVSPHVAEIGAHDAARAVGAPAPRAVVSQLPEHHPANVHPASTPDFDIGVQHPINPHHDAWRPRRHRHRHLHAFAHARHLKTVNQPPPLGRGSVINPIRPPIAVPVTPPPGRFPPPPSPIDQFWPQTPPGTEPDFSFLPSKNPFGTAPLPAPDSPPADGSEWHAAEDHPLQPLQPPTDGASPLHDAGPPLGPPPADPNPPPAAMPPPSDVAIAQATTAHEHAVEVHERSADRATSGSPEPTSTVNSDELSQLRGGAAKLAQARQDQAVGVISDASGKWSTFGFPDAASARDWYVHSTDHPDTFSYAAFFDRSSPRWPAPEQDLAGSSQAISSATAAAQKSDSGGYDNVVVIGALALLGGLLVGGRDKSSSSERPTDRSRR